MQESSTPPEPRRTRHHVRELLEAVVITILVVLAVRVSVVQAYHVPTGSMKSTVLVGDYLLVNKFIYGVRTPDFLPFTDISIPHTRLPAFKEPQPGEIVVFKFPNDHKLDYVKRCLAVSGQTVEIRDGQFFIDGRPEALRTELRREFDAEEGRECVYYAMDRGDGHSYVIREYADSRFGAHDEGPIVVPEGHYFMVGDNRSNSYDSRHWGFVPRDNIVGEAMLVYWSMDATRPFTQLLSKIRWGRIGTLLQ